MIIGVIKENNPSETRVPITPKTAALFIKAGINIIMEQNAGAKAHFQNVEYSAVGVKIAHTKEEVLSKCNILLKILPPSEQEIKLLPKKSMIISNIPHNYMRKFMPYLKLQDISCFAINKLPRISKAQSFDILSSQDNLSGYQAVLKATQFMSDSLPLMITSAGTLPPAKILIIGVGVAGLQAIATAKRLGAKVYAYDINKQLKEQAESLGAQFVDDFSAILKDINVIITTVITTKAHPPKIITKKMLEKLPPNTILIDMASAQGGNIENSINMKIVHHKNCLIYGNSSLACEIPHSASILISNNFYNFVMYIYSPGNKSLNINKNDEIIQSVLLKG